MQVQNMSKSKHGNMVKNLQYLVFSAHLFLANFLSPGGTTPPFDGANAPEHPSVPEMGLPFSNPAYRNLFNWSLWYMVPNLS